MRTPEPFDLDLTVRSHGFYDLAPWCYAGSRGVVSRPVRLSTGRTVVVEAAPGGRGGGLAVRLVSVGRLAPQEAREGREALRACLALDEDLGPFHRRILELEGRAPLPSGLPRIAWAAERGAGRLLRSPTVFEDAVKTLCTTNCTWALTRTMVKNLVERLGEPAPLGTRAFPTAEAMAAKPERFYREVVRAGYRAPHLVSLARAVASGALEIEAWRSTALPTDELGRRILALEGFGPYASEHLLRLLGRHEHLALDSWTRGKIAELRGRRRPPSDRTIARWYAPYAPWSGLAMWLEVTADWHAGSPAWP